MQKRWRVGLAACMFMMSDVFGLGATQLPADRGATAYGWRRTISDYQLFYRMASALGIDAYKRDSR